MINLSCIWTFNIVNANYSSKMELYSAIRFLIGKSYFNINYCLDFFKNIMKEVLHMNPKYEKILEPFTLPSGVKLKNRVLMAPMTTQSSFITGTVTKDELDYYSLRAGGPGAIITACASVEKKGRAFPGGMSIETDKMIPSLRKLANTIKEKGSKAILQIYHGGRMVQPKFIEGETPVCPSPVKALREWAVVPRELTHDEIVELIKAFGEAARRAIQAGFDGIEIHGANTYLIQQFFSPHSNRRTDEWGGTLEKRMRFPLEVVRACKEAVKKYAKEPFAIGYRFSPEELEEPGIRFEDTMVFLEALAEEKLDYLHISTSSPWRGSIVNKRIRSPVVTDLRETRRSDSADCRRFHRNAG